jgi:hypothetical protein
MAIQKAIEVVNRLAEDGVIERYAIAGAIAALNYIQPTFTEDLDVLISAADFEARESGLIMLTPIEEALAKMGYTERSDIGVRVEGWPIQFLPAGSALDEEALSQAIEVDLGLSGGAPVSARVLRAEHVVAVALRLGRFKDLARVEAFLDQEAVDLLALKGVLERFDLMPAWRSFCLKAGKPDVLT